MRVITKTTYLRLNSFGRFRGLSQGRDDEVETEMR